MNEQRGLVMNTTLLTPEGFRGHLERKLSAHQRQGHPHAQTLTVDQLCHALVGLHRETRSPLAGVEEDPTLLPIDAAVLAWVRTAFDEDIGLLTLVLARALDEAWVRGERTDDAQRTAVRHAVARVLHHH
jgi:hypothetical protein